MVDMNQIDQATKGTSITLLSQYCHMYIIKGALQGCSENLVPKSKFSKK
jgi:hypothetical protein